jgi:transposase
MGRTKRLSVTTAQKRALKVLVSRSSASAGHVRRARVVLMAADEVPGVEIARRLSLSVPQVSRIRKRFEASKVKGLADQPKAGRGNNVPEAVVRQVVATVMSSPPAGHSHWSTRELGRRVGLGHTAVHRILRANDLKPHRQRTFKISKDPHFSEKARDVVGLYLNPPQNAVVISLDEKTQVQALDRTQPMLPLRPGQTERRTHDYKRNGVLDLFAALEVATGRVVGDCRDSHTGQDFLRFLRRLHRTFRKGELHVILDNSSTHKTPDVYEWLAAHPRVVFHFTPTSASWLNQVEGFFSILTRRSLKRASFPSKTALRRHIEAFLRNWNEDPTPFVWTKSPRRIVRDHRRMLDRISRTEH